MPRNNDPIFFPGTQVDGDIKRDVYKRQAFINPNFENSKALKQYLSRNSLSSSVNSIFILIITFDKC